MKKHGICKTDYAKSIGYTGSKPVMVQDGRVVSHRNQCWTAFCEKLRRNVAV